MASFALITEGITDQAALESILSGHYEDEQEFRQIQPPRDETDSSRQGDYAGWEKVLEFCSLQKFADIFSTNDYAIIQIDTDICEHANCNIPLTLDGKDIVCAELIGKVKALIVSRINPDVYQLCKDKIFFAISVHSLECWLIPLAKNKNVRRTKNCWGHLQRELIRRDQNLEKSYPCYQEISKFLDRKKNLIEAMKTQESLKIFVDSLPVDS